MNWLIQICTGLDYLHSHKIIHRDLKAENIFLTENNGVKIGDFGISKALENTNAAAQTYCGTPSLMSPEILMSAPYTGKADMWSLGVVLYDLCTGHMPYKMVGNNILGLAN